MALAWEEIMEKAPVMKALVEAKIAEEANKKQVDIDALVLLNQSLTEQIDTLALEVLNLMGV